MSSVKTMRRTRAGGVGVLALNMGFLAFGITQSAGLIILLSITGIFFLLLGILLQTRIIQRREYLDRPRPDYAATRRTKLEYYAVTTALALAVITIICAATGRWGDWPYFAGSWLAGCAVGEAGTTVIRRRRSRSHL